VPNPREVLVELLRILKPGGELIVAVPNFSSLQARWAGAAWFHLDLPRHLKHFPVTALWQLLDSVGFDCRAAHHFSLRQNPFGWVQSALNKLNWFPRNGLYALLHRRGGFGTLPFSRSIRVSLRILFWLLSPIALVLSVIAAALRSGATVHIVARKKKGIRG
jgi:hypothetical protein